MSTGQASAEIAEGVGTCLNCNHEAPIIAHTVRPPSHGAAWRGDGCDNLVTHSLRGEGHDASEDGTGRGTPLVVARGFQWQSGFGDSGSEEISGTVVKNQTPAVMQAIAIRTANTGANGHGVADGVSHTLDGANGQCVSYGSPVKTTGHQGDNVVGDGDVFPCVPAQAGNNGGGGGALCHTGSVVRRLTPRECERLQGFPDDWTRIPWRGKPEAECPDGPRYKAIGNSWAVPCARWIGERIEMVEKILEGLK